VDLFLVELLPPPERTEGGMVNGGRGAPGPRAPTLTIPNNAGFNLETRFSLPAEAEGAGPGFSSEGFSKKTVDRLAIPVGAEAGPPPPTAGAGEAVDEVVPSSGAGVLPEMSFVVARREM
jgi:hypothetical protein